MRFRAVFTDIGSIQHLNSVVNTLSKLNKSECILRITPDNLYFLLTDQLANASASGCAWCQVPQVNFCEQFDTDGVSKEHNEIYLELSPDNLGRALRTATSNAKQLKVKLTKKHCPCLTVEVSLPSLSSNARVVTHDIPVLVLAPRLWDQYKEPPLPEFNVSIYLPPLKVLRNVIERMRNLSSFVTISANNSHEMSVGVETDMTTVCTYFKDLGHPARKCLDEEGAGEPDQRAAEEETFYSVRVDIRRLSQFLSSHQMTPTKVICNVAEDNLVHFYLLHEDLSFQYILPSVSL